MQGTQISLMVELIGAGIAVIVGTLYGATAGYVGGRTRCGDDARRRCADVDPLYVRADPALELIFGRSMSMLFLGIGLISWLDMSRIIARQTLSLKHREFIEAARATGVPAWKMSLRHIVPNLYGRGRGLCHAAGAADDPVGKLYQLSGPGRAGAP